MVLLQNSLNIKWHNFKEDMTKQIGYQVKYKKATKEDIIINNHFEFTTFPL